MAILRVYDISTVEKVKEIEMEAGVRRNNNYKSEYTVDDIMLVRTTDYLPDNRVMRPFSETKTLNKDNNNFLSDQLYIDEIETYYPFYRTTLHACENGLVSSHIYGNFDNRNFIFLEPLNEQLDKANIINFAAQDTIIKGDITISENAILIIEASKYPELASIYKDLDSYNICLYNGINVEMKEKFMKDNPLSLGFEIQDEKAIVNRILMDLGYTPELIGTKHIIQSNTSQRIVDLNDKLAEKRGVYSNTNHQFTDVYLTDFASRVEIKNKCDRMLLDFIIKLNNLELNKEQFLDSKGCVKSETAEILVNMIGIEALRNSVSVFNSTFKQMEKEKLLPTPEEFLNNMDLDLYNIYTRGTGEIKRT